MDNIHMSQVVVPYLYPVARHGQQCMPKESNDLTEVV